MGWGSHKPHSEECEVSPAELGQFSKVFNSDGIKAVFEGRNSGLSRLLFCFNAAFNAISFQPDKKWASQCKLYQSQHWLGTALLHPSEGPT